MKSGWACYLYCPNIWLSTNNSDMGSWKGKFRARDVSSISGVRVLHMSRDSAGDVNARDFSGRWIFLLEFDYKVMNPVVKSINGLCWVS